MALVRVGLNLIFLVPGETGGMEIYARELLPRLAARGEHELVAFVNREAAGTDWGPGIREVVVPVNARNRIEWVRGEQQHLPRLARAEGCALVHSLASTAPLRGRFVRVTTIHDLMYLKVPEAHFGVRGLGMRVLVPGAARRSQRVIVDAASTAEDLRSELGVAPAKIDVVPLGVGAAARAVPTPAAALRERLHLLDRPVLLSVSAKRPHKNLMRLIEAHAALGPARPLLVLPGYRTEHEDELGARAAELGTLDDVRFPAWLPDEDLEGLYALADAFVFPSRYEGFGLPVLEAMARGVPVATSAASSLAEVAGDAALLFDPEDTDALAAALRTLLAGGPAVEALRDAGRARAATFTWEQTAAGTAASYARALA